MDNFSTYLEEATKLWYGFDHIPNARNSTTDFIKKIGKAVGKSNYQYIYFDDKFDYKRPKKQLTIKVTDKSVIGLIVSKLGDEYNFQGTSKGWSTDKASGVSVVIQLSGGMRGSGALPRKGEKAAIPSTEEQETGTIRYIESVLKGKRPTKESISSVVGFEFDDIWMWNFEAQYEQLVKHITITNSHKIYLDSGNNDSNILIKLAKQFGLKDQKDNWNPADIWIMSIKSGQIKNDCKDFHTLAEFNAYLLMKFESQEIVGVSLKKITKPKKGKVSVVKANDMPLVSVRPARILFNAFNTNFILETAGNISNFNLRVGYKAGTIKGDGDIRVYIEGRMKGAKVQLGGVSSKLFPELAKEQGFDIASYKKKMLKMDQDQLVKELDRLRSKINGGAVSDNTNTNDAIAATLPQLKAAVFLTYYLVLFMKSDPEILSSCYYSSTKRNSFSSVHLKVY